ncbi:MAG: DUF433 domain-containing protein [Magnetococcales bacterium]|nr:DUF433 domain-containing protein [Magnetococcales bacterium]
MSHLHRITVNPNQCGGRPCIRGLRVRVKDVLDLLAAGLTRNEILEDFPYLEAEDLSATLEYVTKDDDFVKRRCLLSDGPSIVWVRVGNVGNKSLLVWFEKTLPDLESALLAGESIVEIV